MRLYKKKCPTFVRRYTLMLRYTISCIDIHSSSVYVDERLRLILLEHALCCLYLSFRMSNDDEPPSKRYRGGSDSDQCALDLLAASAALKTAFSASLMSSSRESESCEKRQSQCSKDDPCLIALVSASDALNSALTALMIKQSCRVCSCPPPVC